MTPMGKRAETTELTSDKPNSSTETQEAAAFTSPFPHQTVMTLNSHLTFLSLIFSLSKMGVLTSSQGAETKNEAQYGHKVLSKCSANIRFSP